MNGWMLSKAPPDEEAYAEGDEKANHHVVPQLLLLKRFYHLAHSWEPGKGPSIITNLQRITWRLLGRWKRQCFRVPVSG